MHPDCAVTFNGTDRGENVIPRQPGLTQIIIQILAHINEGPLKCCQHDRLYWKSNWPTSAVLNISFINNSLTSYFNIQIINKCEYDELAGPIYYYVPPHLLVVYYYAEECFL